jgi:hypothetical protein
MAQCITCIGFDPSLLLLKIVVTLGKECSLRVFT